MHIQFWLEDLMFSNSVEKLNVDDGDDIRNMLLGTGCEDIN